MTDCYPGACSWPQDQTCITWPHASPDLNPQSPDRTSNEAGWEPEGCVAELRDGCWCTCLWRSSQTFIAIIEQLKYLSREVNLGSLAFISCLVRQAWYTTIWLHGISDTNICHNYMSSRVSLHVTWYNCMSSRVISGITTRHMIQLHVTSGVTTRYMLQLCVITNTSTCSSYSYIPYIFTNTSKHTTMPENINH